MNRKLKIVLSSTVIVLSLLLILILDYWRQNLPLISPVDLIENLPSVNLFFKNKSSNKVVFGFFPYWNIKVARDLQIHDLTHLAYFGVDFNADGSIKKYDKPGQLEPGWNQLDSNELLLLKRQLKILNKKYILVARGMDDDLIEKIVNNPATSQKAIAAVIDTMTSNQFDGINLDFEYVGSPSPKTKNNFTDFVKRLASECKIANPSCEISVDILADTAAKNRIHDLPAIADYVDQIIIMAYDFYRPSSSQAGPVAPLRGKCGPDNPKETNPNCLEYDVVSSVSDISRLVNPAKLILGVPFYGYEWQVASNNFLANVYPKTGSIATYKRIQNLLINPPDVNTFALSWNDSTKSPYLTYQDEGKTYQIHYENTLSLRLKLDLINQANLKGLAIWAIGYETPYTDLWETISRFL